MTTLTTQRLVLPEFVDDDWAALCAIAAILKGEWYDRLLFAMLASESRW